MLDFIEITLISTVFKFHKCIAVSMIKRACQGMRGLADSLHQVTVHEQNVFLQAKK